METNRECVCCKEIPKILEKMSKMEVPVNCITEHPGFDGVCLNVWVLQTAYSQYRQHYDTTASSTALHEYVKTGVCLCVLLAVFFIYLLCFRKYRYTAYRQLTRWCWGWLGRDIRVILPSCAVNKIRQTFPSETYTGFKYPALS